MRWLVIVFLVACEKPTPTCDELERHAVANIRARGPLPKESIAKLLIARPFDPKLTVEDGRYLHGKCEAWPADYRRCVANRFDEWVPCGTEHDIDWLMLPHVKAWRDGLLDLGLEIGGVLSERLFDLGVETGTTQAELAKLDPKDTALRAPLEAQLATLRETTARTQALKKTCVTRPLETAECVAVLTPPEQ
jgi:hypothetical protein